MAKHTRTARPVEHSRVAHTKQKEKPRLVTKAHKLERSPDLLEFDDVRRVLARAESSRRPRKG